MIILKGKDNEVAIMSLREGADKEEAIKKFTECHPGYSEAGEDIPLPSDRQFRDAWRIDNKNKIYVDVGKAKEIHLNRIRALRDEKLKELDLEAIKNLSDKDKLKDIEDKKQILRDIPQNYRTFDIKKPAIPPELI